MGCAAGPLERDDAGARRHRSLWGNHSGVLISRAITGPLDSLVGAVRALRMETIATTLQPRGSREMAEMGSAFNSMRLQLLELQRKQLEAERLAALGRAAGSISHDLRHQLAAVVANAEFLYNVDELNFDREEIYSEVRRGASQMTELIDSLVEISRDKPSLVPVPWDLSQVVTRAAESVHASPDFRDISIDIREHGQHDGSLRSPQTGAGILQSAVERLRGKQQRKRPSIGGCRCKRRTPGMQGVRQWGRGARRDSRIAL